MFTICKLLLAALALALALLAAPGAGQSSRVAPPPAPPSALANEVSEQQLRAYVERLVGFGTRHTLSSQDHPTRGIGAALNWTEAEFRRIGRECGGCLEIARPSEVVTGRRIPTPTRVTNVIAIQRGTTEPNRVVIITGHIDSRVTDVMNATADAPGANDDGSGTAAVIEAARILSKHRFPATIVYAALSGEEQGLYGGRILADYARARGWEVEANLNNDIIGNSCGSDGVCDAANVRVFSEGLRWQGGEELRPQVRSLGGENDSPSRNLSRWLASLAAGLGLGVEVRQIWRNDRFGRGGDHTEFLNAGFPAVRLSVAVENYDHQHQDLRKERTLIEDGASGDPFVQRYRVVEYGDTIDKMDFAYLRRVTALNVAALAALARAPMPPEPAVEGAVSTDTRMTWKSVAGAEAFVLRWRRTDADQWQHSLRLDARRPEVCDQQRVLLESMPSGLDCRAVLRGIRVDDWVFGLSSVAADGSESPVASAVPGGAFRPWAPPRPAAQAPRVQGAVSTDATLAWPEVQGAEVYVIRWRRTDASGWQHSMRVGHGTPGAEWISHDSNFSAAPNEIGPSSFSMTLPGIRVDDHVFGVWSVAADGSESPVAFAVPGGAFRPWTPPPAQ